MSLLYEPVFPVFLHTPQIFKTIICRFMCKYFTRHRPAQSSDDRWGAMGAVINTSAARASSNSKLCCTTLAVALWKMTTTKKVTSSQRSRVYFNTLEATLTFNALDSPMRQEMAALKRKSSVKWVVTWQEINQRNNQKKGFTFGYGEFLGLLVGREESRSHTGASLFTVTFNS